MRSLLWMLPLAVSLLAACGPPHRDLPPAEIDKLDDLSKVMDVQATLADPQFKKVDQVTYGDEDWASFADVGSRIQVTSKKIHQFTKGPEFDRFADRLHGTAEALSTAASAKDAHAASDALRSMKATCKACHSKFK